MTIGLRLLLLAVLASGAISSETCAAPADPVDARPTAAAWAALAKLPDWSGTWDPDVPDQDRQLRSNIPPWRPEVARQVQRMAADEKAGDPRGLFVDCLPEGMPAWMLVNHDPMEVLFTPGRVTLLGGSDNNRLRRIYTDGRGHPEDPDLTFHGHSIGHWEGSVLVVDTTAVLPQTFLAVSEAVGVPNDGDLHVVERIHLGAPDELLDELTITAPKILTAPWRTTRRYVRQRARRLEIGEGICIQGNFTAGKDVDGHAAFVPVPHKDGNRVPGQ